MHLQVGYALRNRAVVHMLSYKDNESGANIPQFVRDLVNLLGSDFFVWKVAGLAILNNSSLLFFIVYSYKRN